MTHRITLQATVQLTPDTHYYAFSKPKGYSFIPGQATELALDQTDWRDEGRPFTFVSALQADVLAFIIKSYPDHDGVTARLPQLRAGDTVLIEDPWGEIEDKGPGVFIAAGAGITPFIPILQHRAERGLLEGCTLLYANRSERDIILQPYWDQLTDFTADFPLSSPRTRGANARKIDAAYLTDKISDWTQTFYLRGPETFETDVAAILADQGVGDDSIVREG